MYNEQFVYAPHGNPGLRIIGKWVDPNSVLLVLWIQTHRLECSSMLILIEHHLLRRE